MIEFLLKVVWIAELVCTTGPTGGQMGGGRTGSKGICRFPVDLVGRRALVFLGDSNIKEGDGVVWFNLHGELDALVLLVDVLEELGEFLSAMWPYDESIVHVTEPEGGLEMG